MRKSSGRKILGVFIFCFVSISVFGISGNELRNNLPLLLSQAKESSNPFISEKFIGNTPLQLQNLPLFNLSGGLNNLPYTNSNVSKHADIVCGLVSSQTFLLDSSLALELPIRLDSSASTSSANAASMNTVPGDSYFAVFNHLPFKFDETQTSPSFSKTTFSTSKVAATITSTLASGNWNDPVNWVGGVVPHSRQV